MNRLSGLEGKSVVVTGGGSGIGQACGVLLGKSGCDVTISDVNEVGGQATADSINSEGAGRARFVRADVSVEAQVRSLIDITLSVYGRLDGAINSAGVAGVARPLHEITADEFDRIVGINLRGMFLCLKYQIAAMSGDKGGSIVAISSTAAVNGLPRNADYCTSKAGINGLVRAGAIDYADKKIRINAIMPGGTWTPLSQKAIELNPGLQKVVVDAIPMKRYADASEIAMAAVWLVSDQASYVTGTSFPVDGALSIV